MEPATIAVLVFTSAFLALCIWVERNSRRQSRAAEASEPKAEDSTQSQSESRFPYRTRSATRKRD